MNMLRLVVLALGIAALVPVQGFADSDDVEVEVKDERDKYEYEYEGPGCEFEYELDYETGEEKVEEEGDCPPRHALPRFAPPAPYRAGSAPASQLPRLRGRSSRGTFCDRALAGAAAGAAAGGTIGSQVAGIVLGELIGDVLGHGIARRVDAADRRCLGRTLDHAGRGVDVGWTNPESGLRYDLRGFGPPRSRHGVPCRSFEMRVEDGRWREAEACQRGDGAWQLLSMQ